MNDREFDKAAADEWIATIEGDGSRVRAADLYPYLRQWLQKTKPLSVLDLGCGQGACSHQMNMNSCSYTGVDPSPFLLDRARQICQNPNAQFVLGNAYSLPFEESCFDGVFSIAVWHLLEDKAKASKELSRVIRGNGNFLIVAANPGSYEDWTRTYSESKRNGIKFEGTNVLSDGTKSTDILYLHSLDEIVECLNRFNLRVEETQTFRTAIALQGRKTVS